LCFIIQLATESFSSCSKPKRSNYEYIKPYEGKNEALLTQKFTSGRELQIVSFERRKTFSQYQPPVEDKILLLILI
jgi:hypothetical protein